MNELPYLLEERARLIKAQRYDFLMNIEARIKAISGNFNSSHNLRYNEHDIEKQNSQKD